MSPKSIILAVIAVLILTITLPLMATNLVTARATTGVSTNFTSGLDISELLLGLAPVGLLIGFLAFKFARRGF